MQVTDPAAFQAYAAKVPDTPKPYNGRTIVRGTGDALEGEPPKGSVVVGCLRQPGRRAEMV